MSRLRLIAIFPLAALLLFAGVGAPRLAPQTPAPAPPPRFQPTAEMLAQQAASEKEHQRELDVLGIKELRPRNGDAHAPNAANYDESKANRYPTLPDPLVLNDGKRVTLAKEWWRKRRPEIVELYDREILGRTPTNLPKVTWEVVSTTREKNGGVEVITKQLKGHVDNSIDPAIKVDIDLTLSTPASAAGPVPVIMEFGFSKEFLAMLAQRFPQFAAAQGPGPTWQQQVLARGWGYAELIPTSYQDDNGAGLDKGIIGLMNKGQPRKMDDWGRSRRGPGAPAGLIDYFETDKAVDAKQIGLEGHSRYGKATLVTMAYEPRLGHRLRQLLGRGRRQLTGTSTARRWPTWPRPTSSTGWPATS